MTIATFKNIPSKLERIYQRIAEAVAGSDKPTEVVSQQVIKVIESHKDDSKTNAKNSQHEGGLIKVNPVEQESNTQDGNEQGPVIKKGRNSIEKEKASLVANSYDGNRNFNEKTNCSPVRSMHSMVRAGPILKNKLKGGMS